MSSGTPINWAPERVARLKELWDMDKSTPQIGFMMRMSANAVVGKANRLGLTRPPHYNQNQYSTGGRNIADRKPHRGARPIKIDQTIYGTPKPLSELENGDCRWPIGEGKDMTFCCARVVRGSYCKAHGDIAYIKGRRW